MGLIRIKSFGRCYLRDVTGGIDELVWFCSELLYVGPHVPRKTMPGPDDRIVPLGVMKYREEDRSIVNKRPYSKGVFRYLRNCHHKWRRIG